MKLAIPTPADFSFTSAVCSHGFFMLAPNRWDGAQPALHTALASGENRALAVVLTADDDAVHVTIPRTPRLSAASRASVLAGVRRILRLDEDLTPFHDRCRQSRTHGQAATSRFGRLIRSATLFEDVVKVICTCNVTWRQTTAMIDALVAQYGTPAANDAEARAFPTPAQLAAVHVDALRRTTRVGYRATTISRLARDVADGRTVLDRFEAPGLTSEALHGVLQALPGIGPYGAASLCMLLGRYDRLAVDTELRRFWRENFPRCCQTDRAVEIHYRPFQPYAYLAYWWDLWCGYARTHGDPAAWQPAHDITTPRSKPV